jgi:hypothetical protein
MVIIVVLRLSLLAPISFKRINNRLLVFDVTGVVIGFESRTGGLLPVRDLLCLFFCFDDDVVGV